MKSTAGCAINDEPPPPSYGWQGQSIMCSWGELRVLKCTGAAAPFEFSFAMSCECAYRSAQGRAGATFMNSTRGPNVSGAIKGRPSRPCEK